MRNLVKIAGIALLFVIVGVVTAYLGTEGKKLWNQEDQKKLDEMKLVLAKELLAIETDEAQLEKLQQELQLSLRKMIALRDQAAALQRQYPAGAPAGVVKTHQQMAADFNQLQAAQNERIKAFNSLLEKVQANIFRYNQSVANANGLGRKIGGPNSPIPGRNEVRMAPRY